MAKYANCGKHRWYHFDEHILVIGGMGDFFSSTTAYLTNYRWLASDSVSRRATLSANKPNRSCNPCDDSHMYHSYLCDRLAAMSNITRKFQYPNTSTIVTLSGCKIWFCFITVHRVLAGPKAYLPMNNQLVYIELWLLTITDYTDRIEWLHCSMMFLHKRSKTVIIINLAYIFKVLHIS